MKTELEHSREAVNHLRTFAQQARWERCARHCLAMQQRFALCCEPTFLYGLDYPEVTALMDSIRTSSNLPAAEQAEN